MIKSENTVIENKITLINGSPLWTVNNRPVAWFENWMRSDNEVSDSDRYLGYHMRAIAERSKVHG